MASPAKIRKVDNSDNNRAATTTYKNNQFSQSRMKLYMHEERADVDFGNGKPRFLFDVLRKFGKI